MAEYNLDNELARAVLRDYLQHLGTGVSIERAIGAVVAEQMASGVLTEGSRESLTKYCMRVVAEYHSRELKKLDFDVGP